MKFLKFYLFLEKKTIVFDKLCKSFYQNQGIFNLGIYFAYNILYKLL
jgi:hypothetical protein